MHRQRQHLVPKSAPKGPRRRRLTPDGTVVANSAVRGALAAQARTASVRLDARQQLMCLVWCARQAGLPKLPRDVLAYLLEFVLGEDVVHIVMGTGTWALNTRTGVVTALKTMPPISDEKPFKSARLELVNFVVVPLEDSHELVVMGGYVRTLTGGGQLGADPYFNTSAFVYSIDGDSWNEVRDALPPLQSPSWDICTPSAVRYKNVIAVIGNKHDFAVDCVTLERLALGQRPNADVLYVALACMVGSWLVVYSTMNQCFSAMGARPAHECCVALQCVDLEEVVAGKFPQWFELPCPRDHSRTGAMLFYDSGRLYLAGGVCCLTAASGKRDIRGADDEDTAPGSHWVEWGDHERMCASEVVSSLDLRQPPDEWAWKDCITDGPTNVGDAGYSDVAAAVTARGVLWMDGFNRSGEDRQPSFDVTIGVNLLTTLPDGVPMDRCGHTVTRH